jgi:hypothetical protein
MNRRDIFKLLGLSVVGCATYPKTDIESPKEVSKRPVVDTDDRYYDEWLDNYEANKDSMHL